MKKLLFLLIPSMISFATVPAFANTVTPNNLDTVIDAYADILYEQEGSAVGDSVFGLVYLDDDEIPELYVSNGSYHMASLDIYTYQDGEIIQVGYFGSCGACEVAPEEGMIYSNYTGMGSSYDSFYYFEEGEIEDEVHLEATMQNTDTLLYYVDKEQISEEEYNETFEEYYDPYTYIFVGQYSDFAWEINYENVEGMRNCFEDFLAVLPD